MLHELVEYAEKHLDCEPGFTTRTVRWRVDVSAEGGFINVLPLGLDAKGEQTLRCPDMHNIVVGGRAHFLVESLQTIALFCKPNETPGRVIGFQNKHRFFSTMVKKAALKVPMLMPLGKFLKDEEQLEGLRHRLSQIKAKPTDWVSWNVAGSDPLRHPEVLEWWRAWRKTDKSQGQAKSASTPKLQKATVAPLTEEADMVCFLSGARVKPLQTNPKITGLSGVGGLSMGDVLVGFDKAAYRSFGLEQACNAAMGEAAVSKYVAALNHLIKSHSSKLANTLVLHWYQEALRPEDDPLDILIDPLEASKATARSSARQVLESLRSGERSEPTDNHFYAMTISGASGRVMVRDWMEGSFKDLASSIEKWFSDMEIVAQDGGKLAPEPKFIAVLEAMVRELKDLQAQASATIWRVAITDLPIPLPFVAQALVRFRRDILDDKIFNHARMGLIKAYFIRKGGNHGMSAYLNKEHPDQAYQCGRLLAVLARLQRAALGDVGAGVVQRSYVTASMTPGLTMSRLVANAKTHLNKLQGGLALWFEGQIAEIMSHFENSIPRTLDLEGQGLFALGYYQQLAACRAERAAQKNGITNITGEDAA